MELINGYKQTELGIIPTDWEIFELGKLKFDISDGNYSSKYPRASDFEETGVPFIRANNIKNMTVNDDQMRYISDFLHRGLLSGHLKKDDILITTRGDIGNIALVPERHIDSNINAQIVRINTNQIINHIYFAYYLTHDIVQRRIRSAETGSALKQLPKSRLAKLPIIIPSIAEQNSIAEALSDVDALINSLDALIAKKRAIKQGVMQELLTGKCRLPGFSGEWNQKKLGEIVEIQKGNLITKETSKDGNIPVIAGGKRPSYYHTKANRTGKTITISASGANAGYVSFHERPIFASDCSTISENNNYDIEFIYQQLLMKQELIYKLQSGGAQPHIHPSDLNPIDIDIPQKTEQQAISKVLSDLDKEICILDSRLSKFKALKEGMMHELLTGRIRLTGGNQ